MRLALKNILNGAGGLNPDGLALDLQFATDKTLTARRGPTPVLTRGSTGTFVGSNGLIQTAAVNAARFDHNPVSPFACRGLLIEEGRENFISFSDAFNDASWGKASAGITAPVVTANQGTSPDGQNTADRIVFGASTAVGQEGHVWKVAGGGTKAAGSSVTASVWLKTETGTATVYLSITEGAIGGTYTACSVTTTWTRFTVTRTLSTTAFVYMEIGPDTRTIGANQPLAAGATALVWGAQLEAGAFPTSYIPTTTSTAARAADVCSITGDAFNRFYNQSEGTMFTDSYPASVTGTVTTFGISNGTASARWLNRFSQNEQAVITASGVESSLDAINPVASQRVKVAVTAKLNDLAMSINGLAVVTDTSQPMPVVDRAGIGNAIGTSPGGAVTIASIRYYKKRLPNAKLQALTA